MNEYGLLLESKSPAIPEDVVRIGERAFCGCTRLAGISLPPRLDMKKCLRCHGRLKSFLGVRTCAACGLCSID
jgi:hypothetical protein